MGRVVVVDLDGTMVDTALDFQAAINRMREQRGEPPLPVHIIMNFVGKGSEHLIGSVLGLNHSPAEVETLLPSALTEYQAAYATINGEFSTVYPGVTEGLERMSKLGWRLACVTNKPHRFAVELLDKKNLLAYFDLVLGGDSVVRKKPDPEPFHAVCRHFGAEPGTVTAIGDSSNDAHAARAAGLASITVSYGYNHGSDVRMLDTDAIVDSLLEAASWLESSQSEQSPGHESA